MEQKIQKNNRHKFISISNYIKCTWTKHTNVKNENCHIWEILEKAKLHAIYKDHNMKLDIIEFKSMEKHILH